MENVDACIFGHDPLSKDKGVKKELVELVRIHIVIFDFPRSPLIINIVWRVSDHQVGHITIHEKIIGVGNCGITAHKTMFAEEPQIT